MRPVRAKAKAQATRIRRRKAFHAERMGTVSVGVGAKSPGRRGVVPPMGLRSCGADPGLALSGYSGRAHTRAVYGRAVGSLVPGGAHNPETTCHDSYSPANHSAHLWVGTQTARIS